MAWQSTNPAAILDAVKQSHLDKVYENTFALDMGERFRGCKLKNSTDQTVTHNVTLDPVVWDGEDFDTDGFHSNTVNPGRATIPSGLAGKYECYFQDKWDPHSTGYREGWIDIANPATTENLPDMIMPSNLGSIRTTYGGDVTVIMAVGQYARHAVYQDSGGNLNLKCTGGQWASYFGLELIK